MELYDSSKGWDLYRRNKYFEWDSGWRHLKCGIDYLLKKGVLDSDVKKGDPDSDVKKGDPDSDVYIMCYSFVYKMCIHEKRHQYAEELYKKFRETVVVYITERVWKLLIYNPEAEIKKSMLERLITSWSDHKVKTRRLSGIFHHLDLYIVRARMKAVDLNGVALTCFRDLVYVQLNGEVRDDVISLIDQEREGEQIDRALLKNVLDIFVEIGMGQMDYYEKDFEADMLKDTAAYYSRKATSWIQEDSCPDYMLKAEECLKREKERVSHYLHSSSEPKLLEKVQHELLSVYASQLLEKEHSGCRALLRDDKVQELSRMYRLFSKIPRGLEPVAAIFKQHVTAEGTALVKQAEDAASNKKAEKRDIVGMQEQVFVRKVIELHDKYMAYVNECFMNHMLFHKALKEAFEVFCNKGVAGRSSAELLATFRDNILKKGGSEKLSDEAIEKTLEKVVKLLGYASDKYLFAEFRRKEVLVAHKSSNIEITGQVARTLNKEPESDDDTSHDSSVEVIENVEERHEDGSVISDHRLQDANGPTLSSQKIDGTILEDGIIPASSSEVSHLTKVEDAGKGLKAWSLSPERSVDGVPPHNKLFESASRYNPKLHRLQSDIQLKETRWESYRSLRLEKNLVKEEEEKEEIEAVDSAYLRDPFVPLEKEHAEAVAKAFSESSGRKVLVAHESSNIEITGEALQCLMSRAWLNDEVINLYLELLKERETRQPKKFLKCHFFNTFFYKKLTGGREGYDYKSVQRWTTQMKLGYGLIECEKIFVPIHKEKHWCLAVINKKDQKFQYLDSLGGIDSQVFKVLAPYFEEEVKDKSGQVIDVSSWDREFVTELPEQKNGFDCGMFMIKYADFYSRGMGLKFHQEHMPYFRLRTAKEILQLRAD